MTRRFSLRVLTARLSQRRTALLAALSAAVVAPLAACSVMTPSSSSEGTGADYPQGGLVLASFNMEHLAERDGEGCRPRTGADYAALTAYVEGLAADVVALQEVESAAAAERVFSRTAG